MYHTALSPGGKMPGPQLAIEYRHDLDSGVTVFDVYDYQTGEWFSREMPTTAFAELMDRVASQCRMTEVWP